MCVSRVEHAALAVELNVVGVLAQERAQLDHANQLRTSCGAVLRRQAADVAKLTAPE